MCEVERRQQALAGGEQSALGARRIVHQRVGHEPERPILPVRTTADDPVGDRHRTSLGQVERRVIRADRTKLTREHTPGQALADVKSDDSLLAGELVQSSAVAVDTAAEALSEAVGFTVVVAV